jgi:drug/metabolite transporter (DMT)-like permease
MTSDIVVPAVVSNAFVGFLSGLLFAVGIALIRVWRASKKPSQHSVARLTAIVVGSLLIALSSIWFSLYIVFYLFTPYPFLSMAFPYPLLLYFAARFSGAAFGLWYGLLRYHMSYHSVEKVGSVQGIASPSSR